MKITKILLITFLVLGIWSCAEKLENAIIISSQSNEVNTFAQKELVKFAEKSGKLQFTDNENKDKATWIFSFEEDKSMPLYSFSYTSEEKQGKNFVAFKGADATTQLHAVYSFLEKGGYRFEMTGAQLNHDFNLKLLKNTTNEIIPAVKKRGIRQHINFTMDVSAWTESEAKEYIRNLARMRFNYITFHSYPGQWFEVGRKDTTEYAGHFFYGKTHLIPSQKDIKAIVKNEKYFCIPEIEPFFEDKATRSKKAIKWLSEVMKEAKRTGMQVQFSFEPRNRNLETDVEKTVETVKSILHEYPMIDALEFITEEAGGWGPGTTRKNTEKTIVEHFGKEFLKDTVVMKPVRDKQSDLAYLYAQVGLSAKIINYLIANNILPEKISPKIGIYCAIPEYANASYYLARKIAPEIETTMLSGHQSSRVKNNIPQIIHNKTDWDKSMIYSWIEFDGMMYLQQNGISGIHDLISMSTKRSSGNQGNAILFNHWRTAENSITARYAAEATLKGGIDSDKFYKEHAAYYGIQPVGKFAQAMKILDDTDLYGTDNLGNFGFCWEGRWRNGFPVTGYSKDRLENLLQGYENVRAKLKACAMETTNTEGEKVLSLMDNRLITTVIYIKAFQKAWELDNFDISEALSEKDKEEYVRICNEVLAIFGQYIHLYAQENADRGCVGNLVSLWHGPVKGIKILRQKYGGVPMDEEIPQGTAIDEPPLPIINTNN